MIKNCLEKANLLLLPPPTPIKFVGQGIKRTTLLTTILVVFACCPWNQPRTWPLKWLSKGLPLDQFRASVGPTKGTGLPSLDSRTPSLSLLRERRPESRPWFRCWNYYLFVSVSELSNILVFPGFFFRILLWCTCFVCLRNFEKKRSKTAWCERKKKRPAVERCCRGCSLVVFLVSWRFSLREASVLAIFLSQWSSIPLRYVSIMPTSTFWRSVVLKMVEQRQRNLHLPLQI